ncbi:hypothetical protein ADICYQ_1610 [Cyclobacterium qasimii M12-11B]|uniref:Uncharacterized protein n=1 Tax=Cyclobacterium qasimii M12-11B TaxID=641524 RepID=S7VGM0_9BACT|nr:hypothetical protein ADICYQ_1610 [Cyclobacterium qasimii M12-11B]
MKINLRAFSEFHFKDGPFFECFTMANFYHGKRLNLIRYTEVEK